MTRASPTQPPVVQGNTPVGLFARVASLLLAVVYGILILPLQVFSLGEVWPALGVVATLVVVGLLVRVAFRGWRFTRQAAIAFAGALLVSGATQFAVMRSLSEALGEYAYVNRMKSDLRVLMGQQMDHLDSTGRFAAELSALAGPWSSGVQLQLLDVTDSGWRAIARHASSRQTCILSVSRGQSMADSIPCRR